VPPKKPPLPPLASKKLSCAEISAGNLDRAAGAAAARAASAAARPGRARAGAPAP
jgi:hypothetical protein